MLAVTAWDARLGPLQLSTLRRALEQEGMVTAWWSDMPGTRIATHAHDFRETRWVLSGFLRVTVHGETLQLGPGDRLDLPAGMPHAAEVVGLAPVIYVTGTPERHAMTP
ncbi:MAG TPA: cupin domain-containing protein [Gemmatimonadales bacterium]|jgi:quercetin dioxygenase-like cupin family protein|nr:cupin domain-containing protein [Gemmatimonadales bacterium]